MPLHAAGYFLQQAESMSFSHDGAGCNQLVRECAGYGIPGQWTCIAASGVVRMMHAHGAFACTWSMAHFDAEACAFAAR
jgi:hypothetical protein